MAYLNRDALKKARPRTVDVELPGLGKIKVRGLTAAERAEVESLVLDFDPDTQAVRYNPEGAKRANLLLVAYGALDGDGNQMFDPGNPADLAEIGGLAGDVVERIAQAVRELSGMGEAAAKKERG